MKLHARGWPRTARSARRRERALGQRRENWKRALEFLRAVEVIFRVADRRSESNSPRWIAPIVSPAYVACRSPRALRNART